MKYKTFLTIVLCINSICLVSCSKHSTSETAPKSDISSVETTIDHIPYTSEGIYFSAQSGFYADPFTLTISSENGYDIRYTLDGSTPTIDSPLYTEPIQIIDRSSEPNHFSEYTNISPDTIDLEAFSPKESVDKATVIRVVTVDNKGCLSPVVTNTYFIGYDKKASFYSDMKVLSLVTDEENLFDEENGIFVLGKTYDNWINSSEYDAETPDYAIPANYTQKGREWERPANLQIFENGEPAITQNIGIRVHGGASRSFPQKSLNIYARSEYGESKLQYDLFSGAVKSESNGECITEFDSFMLRNGGNDAQFTRFRDRLNQTLVSDCQFLTQGMVPCILFINGEFWGQYDITERIDADYIHEHCGVSKKDVCIIKKEQLDEGNELSYNEWLDLYEKIKKADFSDTEQYNEICSQIDIQSFIDYVCAELYINNDNWGKSNMAMWKCSTIDNENPFADGKWRFIMFDTDFSSGIYGTVNADEDSLKKLEESNCFLGNLLNALLNNHQFKEEFEKTRHEIAYVCFDTDRVNAQIDEFAAVYHDAAVSTLTRFRSGYFSVDSAEQQFSEEVESVKQFFNERKNFFLQSDIN